METIEDRIRAASAAKRAKLVQQARRKLVNLLSRSHLELMSSLERPWLADTATLKTNVILNWPVDDVREAVDLIFAEAKGE